VIQNVSLVIPELWQIAIVLFLFIKTLGSSPGKNTHPKWLPYAAAINIGIAFSSMNLSGIVFFQAYQIDQLSQFFKLAIAIGFFITVLNAGRIPSIEAEKHSDYFLFLALNAFGLMMLASAVELVTVFIALEIASYSLYAVIPLRGKDPGAAEAAIKYILFGAAATAITLYGLSYILTTQHTTYFQTLASKSWTWNDSALAVVGLTLFMVSFFYKLALFPFHFWCPDVYEGTSNETAAYAATLPKLGAVVILIRIVALIKPDIEIVHIIAILGACSMTFGNLAALTQKDIKRMLGYSSVAHAGYIMVGLSAVSAGGLAAAAFYSLAYVLMNLTCFWVVCRLSTDGRNLKMDDLNGLYHRAPGLAFILAVAAFSLVGLPPTIGFMGKLFLLTAAWNRGNNWLIIVAAVNTAISIYYYLNLVRHAYTSEAEGDLPSPRPGSAFWGGVLAAILLLLGVFPGPVFRYAEMAGELLISKF
jgi:NADH-quinone oxidoreductase subunit N